MTARVAIFPTESLPDCEYCAKRGSAYRFDCYGCRVRFTARQFRHVRIGEYRMVDQQHGAEVLATFKADVAQYASHWEGLGPK